MKKDKMQMVYEILQHELGNYHTEKGMKLWTKLVALSFAELEARYAKIVSAS